MLSEGRRKGSVLRETGSTLETSPRVLDTVPFTSSLDSSGRVSQYLGTLQQAVEAKVSLALRVCLRHWPSVDPSFAYCHPVLLLGQTKRTRTDGRSGAEGA